MTTLTPDLKYFATLQDLADYVSKELLATLETDLLRMTTSERPHYSHDDRKEMRQRLRDVKRFGSYVRALPSLLTVSQEFCSCIDRTGGLITDSKGYRVPQADPDWIDLGETYQQMKNTLRTLTRRNPSRHTHPRPSPATTLKTKDIIVERAPLSSQIWQQAEEILTLTTTPTFASLPLAVRRQLATTLSGIKMSLARQITHTLARTRTPRP